MLNNSNLRTTKCINVFSDMNTWIDFVIIPCNDEDFTKAEEIISKAYDDWWTLPDAEFEPIADWVSDKLKENGIEFEIYFKYEEEEESD